MGKVKKTSKIPKELRAILGCGYNQATERGKEKKTSKIPKELRAILGCGYNRATEMGKENDPRNYVKRYDHLCLRDKESTVYPKEPMEELLNDLYKEIDMVLERTGLSPREVLIEIEKYRYLVAKSRKDGGFAGTKVPVVIRVLGDLALLIISFWGFSVKDGVQWLNTSFGLIGASLFVLLVGDLYFLYQSLKSPKYEEITNKYHDFLIRALMTRYF